MQVRRYRRAVAVLGSAVLVISAAAAMAARADIRIDRPDPTPPRPQQPVTPPNTPVKQPQGEPTLAPNTEQPAKKNPCGSLGAGLSAAVGASLFGIIIARRRRQTPQAA